MIHRLSNGVVAVIGKWPTRDEQLEVDKIIGRSLTVDEQLVILSPEFLAQRPDIATLIGEDKYIFPTTP